MSGVLTVLCLYFRRNQLVNIPTDGKRMIKLGMFPSKKKLPGRTVDDFPNFMIGRSVAWIRTVAKSEPTSASSTTPEIIVFIMLHFMARCVVMCQLNNYGKDW